MGIHRCLAKAIAKDEEDRRLQEEADQARVESMTAMQAAKLHLLQATNMQADPPVVPRKH